MRILLYTKLLYTLLTCIQAFNLDEINSIYYDVDIARNPILKKSFGEDVVMMVNRYGQEYACNLPLLPSDIKGLVGKDDPTSQEDIVDISELLKAMEGAPCLVTSKGWWTYEFCYGQSITQYHMEDDKNRGAVLLLGKYDSEYDWSSGGRGGADVAADTAKNSNRLQRFHSQYYNNGTKCDLTGEPRNAEVRFKCETDIGDYIERVDEPESCRYIVTVATIRVCSHPYLRPNPSRTPHPITCSPVLPQRSYDMYTELQAKSNAAKEKIAAENPATNAEEVQLVELLTYFGSSKDKKKLLANNAIQDKLNAFDEAVDITIEKVEAAKSAGGDALKILVGDDGVTTPTQGRKKSLLDKEYEKLLSRRETDDASKMLKLKDKLEDESDALHDHLAVTLSELDLELARLNGMAAAKRHTEGGQWSKVMFEALAEKVKKMREKAEVMAWKKDREPAERDTLEWRLWKARKNRKMIGKAKEVLGGERDEIAEAAEDLAAELAAKAITEAPAEATTEAADKATTEAPDKATTEAPDKATTESADKTTIEAADKTTTESADKTTTDKAGEDEMAIKDELLTIFSDQFLDEVIKDYATDQDAGSKDGESSSKKEQSPDSDAVMLSSLQESIMNRLRSSGFDNINKHKFEVKILSSSLREGDDETITAEQAQSVETIVVQLMGAHKDELDEKEHQDSLETNYNFSFDDYLAKQREEEEDDDEVDEHVRAEQTDTAAGDGGERQEEGGMEGTVDTEADSDDKSTVESYDADTAD